MPQLLAPQTENAAFMQDAEMLASVINKQAVASEISKTIARQDAGKINMNTYRFKGITQALLSRGKTNGFSAADSEIVGYLFSHLNEAGQAPKNATATASGLEGLQ